MSLRSVQNRLIRIIRRLRKLDHIANNSLYHKLSILKIKDIYHLEMAKFMYLYHNNKLPKLCNNFFKSINSVHSYNTRNACRKNYQLYSLHSNTAKKALHKFGTIYSQNGKISLTADSKKLPKVTLLRIIAKACYQSALSNLIL